MSGLKRIRTIEAEQRLRRWSNLDTLVKGWVEHCEQQKDKDNRVECKFEVLEALTSHQDVINLNIRNEINNMEDPRWWPVIMNNDANAVILHTSKRKGDINKLDEIYIDEKVENLFYRWQTHRPRKENR